MQFCDIHVNFLFGDGDKDQNAGMHRRTYTHAKCQLRLFTECVFKGDKNSEKKKKPAKTRVLM